jgi:hypothetical protein
MSGDVFVRYGGGVKRFLRLKSKKIDENLSDSMITPMKFTRKVKKTQSPHLPFIQFS